MWQTFWISAVVTLLALVAGIPLAAMLWKAPVHMQSPLTVNRAGFAGGSNS